jgi:hypothetical protein
MIKKKKGYLKKDFKEKSQISSGLTATYPASRTNSSHWAV